MNPHVADHSFVQLQDLRRAVHKVDEDVHELMLILLLNIEHGDVSLGLVLVDEEAQVGCYAVLAL